jgi:hypothetical protein
VLVKPSNSVYWTTWWTWARAAGAEVSKNTDSAAHAQAPGRRIIEVPDVTGMAGCLPRHLDAGQAGDLAAPCR